MKRKFDKYSLLNKTPTYMSNKPIYFKNECGNKKPIRKAQWYVKGVKLPNLTGVEITPHGAKFTIEAGLSDVKYK